MISLSGKRSSCQHWMRTLERPLLHLSLHSTDHFSLHAWELCFFGCVTVYPPLVCSSAPFTVAMHEEGKLPRVRRAPTADQMCVFVACLPS
jgi:hypothetical protein